MVLLSLGTGTSLMYIEGKTHDWGYIQWAEPLVTLLLEAVAGIADYQSKQILRERYHRLGPTFPVGVQVALDDVKKIPYMIEFAEKLVDLRDTAQWLRDNWLPA